MRRDKDETGYYSYQKEVWGAKAKTDIRIGKEWLEIEMSPKQYARLIGHSEEYVRKYCIENPEAKKVKIRVRTEDVLEDIWDVRGIGPGVNRRGSS